MLYSKFLNDSKDVMIVYENKNIEYPVIVKNVYDDTVDTLCLVFGIEESKDEFKKALINAFNNKINLYFHVSELGEDIFLAICWRKFFYI